MVCVTNTKPRRATHAFTEECYHIQSRSSSVGIAMAAGCTAVKGSRPLMHGRSGLERRDACRGTHDFRVRGLPRFGQCPFSASGVRRAGGRPAANPASPGKALEL